MKIKQKQKEKQLHSVLENVIYLLKDIYADSRVLFVFLLLEAACAIITPVFGIYLPKIAVDLVLNSAGSKEITTALGSFVLVMTSVGIIQNTVGSAKYIYSNNIRGYYLNKIFYKSLNCDYKNSG